MTVASRRHFYPAWLPILTLLRYMSTIWVTEIATTSFSSPGIHHSAVRIIIWNIILNLKLKTLFSYAIS